MRLVLDHKRCKVYQGDCLALSGVLPKNSVDAIVTDPPSGAKFMAKKWDTDHGGRDQWITHMAELLQPALRALKPGGHALVWALPRTSHWTAMALELAGFEIRDIHHAIFGSGFPKSLTSNSAPIPSSTGTALKPAVEHWVLARKPLEGTVGETFATYGTGVLQIAACRIGSKEDVASVGGRAQGFFNSDAQADWEPTPFSGRWPAHLSLEHHETCLPVCCVIGCPVRTLDAQSGVRTSGARKEGARQGRLRGQVFNDQDGNQGAAAAGSEGGASRFFTTFRYIAKASRREKDAGLDHLPARSGGEATGRVDDSLGTQNPRAGAGRTGGAHNFHPTVKSIELMRWLVRLVTPPGGVVLDPFAGSGTTGLAVLAEGCNFIGVEMTDEYIPILLGRLDHALKGAA